MTQKNKGSLKQPIEEVVEAHHSDEGSEDDQPGVDPPHPPTEPDTPEENKAFVNKDNEVKVDEPPFNFMSVLTDVTKKSKKPRAKNVTVR